jgi:hypothetical protein
MTLALVWGELQLAVVKVHWSDIYRAKIGVGGVPLALLLVTGARVWSVRLRPCLVLLLVDTGCLRVQIENSVYSGVHGGDVRDEQG